MTFFNDKGAGDPKWIAGDEEHEEALAEAGVSVEAACRIPGRPVRWLVENIIPAEAVTVIAGEPGAGKTFFACQLAADAARVSQCRVVLATSGYEPPELLRWRLDQADADTRRVALAVLTPNGFKDRRGGPSEETIDERMAVLYHTLLGAGDPASGILPEKSVVSGPSSVATDEGQRTTADPAFPPLPELPRAAELLVIDDVDGWFGKPAQSLSAAALARVIGRLNELARSLHVAIVVLVRAQMSAEGRITSRQLSRLSQSASVVWMVVKDREQGTGHREQRETERESDGETEGEGEVNPKSKIENPKSAEDSEKVLRTAEDDGRAYCQSARRWLLPVKNNLAPDVATFGRAFELFDGQIRWHGDDPAPSLAEATLPSAHNSDRRRLRHAAALWLEEALAAGPLPSKELYRQGSENGFSQGTLKRAATELGIHPHKSGFNGGWEMRWTPQPVVRGRGTTARRAGAGFRIFAGDAGGRDGATEGDGEKRRQGDTAIRRHGEAVTALDSNCASSRKYDEMDGTSCASSPTADDLMGASCAPSEKRRDFAMASCASSEKCEEMDAASCASSATRDGESGDQIPKTQDLRPKTSDSNPKSKIENPNSDDGCNIYAVIADALREACFDKAC